MRKRRTGRRSRRKIYRGGEFGASQYVSAIAGNTLAQQEANVGTIAPWSNPTNQSLANTYQGGKKRTYRRRRTFRRR
jgi:hypothetical protein